MIKLITGYRDDQYVLIPTEELHKAYYLFNNPEARTIFSNGVAIVGKSIQGIEPAWNEIMGWNPTHKLDGADWNEIKSSGKAKRMNNLLSEAKNLAVMLQNGDDKNLLNKPLSEVRHLLLK